IYEKASTTITSACWRQDNPEKERGRCCLNCSRQSAGMTYILPRSAKRMHTGVLLPNGREDFPCDHHRAARCRRSGMERTPGSLGERDLVPRFTLPSLSSSRSV